MVSDDFGCLGVVSGCCIISKRLISVCYIYIYEAETAASVQHPHQGQLSPWPEDLQSLTCTLRIHLLLLLYITALYLDSTKAPAAQSEAFVISKSTTVSKQHMQNKRKNGYFINHTVV